MLINLQSVPKKCPLGEVLMPISQQDLEILSSLHFGIFVYISEANQHFEVIFSQLEHFFMGPLRFNVRFAQIGQYPYWPLRRSDGLNPLDLVKHVQKVPTR